MPKIQIVDPHPMNLVRRYASSPQFRLFAIVFVLYGLAFNAYVPPTNGDDITYFQGALSIVAGEGFKEQGKWIIDWPPVESILIALTMCLTGIREYYIVKIVNGLAVFVSLCLAYRVMVSENRSNPFLSCVLIAIFPTSLVVGSAGQADFTFFVFSMLFILLVAKLRVRRRFDVAVLCGLLLGVSSLTRWQGVVLGACLVFQAAGNIFRLDRWSIAAISKSIWLEMAAATIGAAIFLSWKLWLQICINSGLGGVSNYEYLGSTIWNLPNPIELFSGLLNLLTQFENMALTLFPNCLNLLALVVSIFIAICIWGFTLRIREQGWLPSDVLFLATVALLSVYAYKESRYGIPIAPFLLDYFFRGILDIHSRAVTLVRGCERTQKTQRVSFVAIWIASLLTFDAVLIFYGDGESMGPSSQLLLVDNRDYLRGYHCDLFDVCKQLPEQYPNAVVASDKLHKQMIRYYSGLETHFVGYAPDAKYNVFIQVDPACLPKRTNHLTKSEVEFPPSLEGRLSNPRKHGFVTLWDVDKKN